VKPTVAPTLDTSLHIRREVCHGWRKRPEGKTRVSAGFVFSAATSIQKKSLVPISD